MTKPIVVLVNRAGGAAAAAGEALAGTLADAFAAAGAAAEIRLLDGDEMQAAIRIAGQKGERVVVAGGDGTVSCAARALDGLPGAELALLPLGTLNHLARDLGIPGDIAAAASLAANGVAAAIDVASVNGRCFVNNASVGLYPFMVRHRDDARERRGWPKWLATLPAAWAALARLPHHRLRIDMGDGEQPLVTSLLFVGNNLYALEAGSVGTRATLADGRLSVFAVAHRTRRALAWFALRALAGRADRDLDFVAIGECKKLTVRSGSGSIEIALDGELVRLRSPLQFSVAPRALAIVAPPPA